MKNELKTEGKILKEESFFDLAERALKNLHPRSQEIVKKRFGLHGEKAKTLDSIGRDYKITRERVRQIIADSFRKISKSESTQTEFKKAQGRIVLEIESKSGIIDHSEILFNLAAYDPKEESAVVFFTECLKDIKIAEKKGLAKKAWFVSDDIFSKIEKIKDISEDILKEKNKPIAKKDLVLEISQKISEFGKKEVEDWLNVLLNISENKFGKWGLSDWPEVNPKSTKDKIYLILKEFEKPLHFLKIAEKIDEHKLSKKKAHPQTVHNELIKDSRFILIGRGIYALSEWGYNKGTVREVLEEILSKNGPMKKEDILKEIMKVRDVKLATVMINLNNQKFFSKVGNLYKIKK